MFDEKKQVVILELLAEIRFSYGLMQERAETAEIKLAEANKKLHSLNTKVLEFEESLRTA